MNSGPGRSGTIRTTRGGGGGPIWTPIEICAANVDTPPNSMAAIKAFFVSLFILLPPSVNVTIAHGRGRLKQRAPFAVAEKPIAFGAWHFVAVGVVPRPSSWHNLVPHETTQVSAAAGAGYCVGGNRGLADQARIPAAGAQGRRAALRVHRQCRRRNRVCRGSGGAQRHCDHSCGA